MDKDLDRAETTVPENEASVADNDDDAYSTDSGDTVTDAGRCGCCQCWTRRCGWLQELDHATVRWLRSEILSILLAAACYASSVAVERYAPWRVVESLPAYVWLRIIAYGLALSVPARVVNAGFFTLLEKLPGGEYGLNNGLYYLSIFDGPLSGLLWTGCLWATHTFVVLPQGTGDSDLLDRILTFLVVLWCAFAVRQLALRIMLSTVIRNAFKQRTEQVLFKKRALMMLTHPLTMKERIAQGGAASGDVDPDDTQIVEAEQRALKQRGNNSNSGRVAREDSRVQRAISAASAASNMAVNNNSVSGGSHSALGMLGASRRVLPPLPSFGVHSNGDNNDANTTAASGSGADAPSQAQPAPPQLSPPQPSPVHIPSAEVSASPAAAALGAKAKHGKGVRSDRAAQAGVISKELLSESSGSDSPASREMLQVQLKYLQTTSFKLYNDDGKLVDVQRVDQLRRIARHTFKRLLAMDSHRLDLEEDEAAEDWETLHTQMQVKLAKKRRVLRSVHHPYISKLDKILEEDKESSSIDLTATAARAAVLEAAAAAATASAGASDTMDASASATAPESAGAATHATNDASLPAAAAAPAPSEPDATAGNSSSRRSSTVAPVIGTASGGGEGGEEAPPDTSEGMQPAALLRRHFRAMLGKDATDTVWSLFDINAGSDCTRYEFVRAFEVVYDEYKGLKSSLRGHDNLSSAIRVLANVAFTAIMLILGLLIFGVDVLEALLSLGTLLLAFSFALQTTVSNAVTGLVFVLVVRPYEVGDVIGVNGLDLQYNDFMEVRSITVLNTELVKWDGKCVLIPNWQLAALPIHNHKRSVAATAIFEFNLGAHTTSYQIRELERRISLYLRSRPLEWRADFDFYVEGVDLSRGTMLISVWVSSQLGWTDLQRVYVSQSNLCMIVAEMLTALDISYVSPPQPMLFPSPLAVQQQPYGGYPEAANAGAGGAASGAGASGTQEGSGAGATQQPPHLPPYQAAYGYPQPPPWATAAAPPYFYPQQGPASQPSWYRWGTPASITAPFARGPQPPQPPHRSPKG